MQYTLLFSCSCSSLVRVLLRLFAFCGASKVRIAINISKSVHARRKEHTSNRCCRLSCLLFNCRLQFQFDNCARNWKARRGNIVHRQRAPMVLMVGASRFRETYNFTIRWGWHIWNISTARWHLSPLCRPTKNGTKAFSTRPPERNKYACLWHNAVSDFLFSTP